MAKSPPCVLRLKEPPLLGLRPMPHKDVSFKPSMSSTFQGPLAAWKRWGQRSRETWRLKICFDFIAIDLSPNFMQH